MDKYYIVSKGGEGEITEKKIPVYCSCFACGKWRGSNFTNRKH